MVPIPGGEFMMGDNFDEGPSAERPVRRVRVHSFYMGKYETTNRQYCDYLNSAKSKDVITVNRGVIYKAGSGASYPYCDTKSSSPYSRIIWDANSFTVASGKNRHPMVKATWYGAVAYCNWRSEQEGYQQCYDLFTWDRDLSKKGYRLPTEAEWEYAARGGCYYFKYLWCSNSIDGDKANYDSSNPLALPS
jgi:sulfatase modifying factor 1